MHNSQRLTHTQKVWNQKIQQCSYAQAVKGGKAGSDQKGEDNILPQIRVNVETSFWLERCFIGKLLKAANVQAVRKSFILGGFNLVRLTLVQNLSLTTAFKDGLERTIVISDAVASP